MSDAWRYWHISRDGLLVSPYTGTPLPLDGRAVAHCNLQQLGQAGVSYLTSKADLLHTIGVLDDAGLAVTEGTLTGPTMPDARVPLYQVGWPLSRTVVLPAGRRCTEYRVTCVYANVPIANYGVPQRKLSDLH